MTNQEVIQALRELNASTEQILKEFQQIKKILGMNEKILNQTRVKLEESKKQFLI